MIEMDKLNKQQVEKYFNENVLYSLDRKWESERALSVKVFYKIEEEEHFVRLINRKSLQSTVFLKINLEIDAFALFRVQVKNSGNSTSLVEIE